MFTHTTCGRSHALVAQARDCEAGRTGRVLRHGEWVGIDDAPVFTTWAEDEFPCDWHVEVATEDGRASAPCGAAARNTDTGWECAAGHEHVTVEARHAQGWDYADDAADVRSLAIVGLAPVGMDGGSYSGPLPAYT